MNLLPARNNQILIFIHVPKCGGSTVGHALASAFRECEFLPTHYSRIGESHRTGDSFLTRSDVVKYVGEMNYEARNDIRFISGHLAYPGIHALFKKTPRYVVFFRHPLERSLSHYFFLKKRVLSNGFLTDNLKKGLFEYNGALRSFSSWLENNPRFHNYMTKYFKDIPEENDIFVDQNDLDATQQALQDAFIGITENLNMDLQYLSLKWGVREIVSKNISNRISEVKPEDVLAVNKHCALDLSLYQWAVKKRRQFLQKNWDYFPIQLLSCFYYAQ